MINRQAAMAAGYTPQQIDAYEKQKQPQSQGFSLSDILPIAGGILGGTAGAVAGPVGAVAGGGAGSAAGEWLRQELTKQDNGKPVDYGNVAKEGAYGLAGGAAGEALGAGGRLLAKGAGNVLSSAGENVAVKSLRLNPSQLTKFASRHGEDVAQFLTNEGAVGKDITKLAEQHIEPLQQSFNTIAKQSGLKINPQTFQDNVLEQAKTLLDAGGSENEAIANKLLDEAQHLVKNDFKTYDISEGDKLRRTFASKVNWQNPEKAAQDYAMADALRKTVIDTADQAGMTGINGQGLKDIGIKLSKYLDLEKYATAQQNLGRGSLPMGISNWLSLAAGNGVGGVPGMAAGLATQVASSSPKVMGGVARGAQAAGDALTNMATTSNVGTNALEQTIGQSGSRGIGQLFGQSDQSSNPSYSTGSDLSSQPPIEGQVIDHGGQLPVLDAQKAVMLMAAYPKQAALIKSIFDVSQSQNKAAKPKSEAQVARDQTGFMVNDALKQISSNQNIKTGMISPQIEEFKSRFNAGQKDTIDFDRTLAGLKASIAKARAGTSFTPNEEKLLDQYTPSVGDSKQQIVSKLTQLQRLFSNPASQGGSYEDTTPTIPMPYSGLGL